MLRVILVLRGGIMLLLDAILLLLSQWKALDGRKGRRPAGVVIVCVVDSAVVITMTVSVTQSVTMTRARSRLRAWRSMSDTDY